jgi:hypothetical protein
MTDDREKRAREHVRQVLKKHPELLSAKWFRQVTRAHMETRDVEWLVDAAREGDKDALELLRNHARGARQHSSLIMPRKFHEFVWEFFIDGPPPAESGPSPRDTDGKYQTIALLVQMVHRDYGFPIYRNVEHRGEKSGPMSACKLVAEELKKASVGSRKLGHPQAGGAVFRRKKHAEVRSSLTLDA